MDQRRLFLFLTLCFLLMIAFGPKPPEPLQDEQAKLANSELANSELADTKRTPAGTQPNAASTSGSGNSGSGNSGSGNSGSGNSGSGNSAPSDSDSSNAADTPPAAAAEVELQYVTLGSVDPESPYRFGVTLTNQGAGVRRVELSSPRFRDLQDRSGHLGHLELIPDDRGGLRIQSLVAGSPAAAAGLEVSDRIVSLSLKDETLPLDSPAALQEQLQKIKPGKKLTLQVARGDQPAVERVVTLGRRPLEVIRPEWENVAMRTKALPANVQSPPSFQFTFEQLDRAKLPTTEQAQQIVLAALELGQVANVPTEIAGVALRQSHWEIAAQEATSVSFRKSVPQFGVEVHKHYRLQPVPTAEQANQNYPGYHLTLELEIRNLGQEALPLRYQLDGPNGLPMEGWWYANKIARTWGAAGIRDVVARHEGNDTVQFGPTEIATQGVEVMQGPPLAFAGVDAQYFSAILLPEKPTLETSWIDELRSISLSPKPKGRSSEGRYANVTCRLVSHEIDLAGGASITHAYQVFVGPKRPDLLANYHASESPKYGLSDLMYYGWFGAVSKPMLGILHFFYGLIGNYGIAIIMLTILVRGCMFPISRKQAKSMAKMQELKPEMDRLKEKYKQDMQKQSQAMQELYRKHNINPLAGCLPLFIQMPIFLGLYRALMVDVELRQAPLLGDAIRWCSNLASPDMLYDWSSWMPEGVNSGEAFLVGLGPYFNILPIATAGLFLLQQKLFMPEPANEQAAIQQKIMKYMMLVMGLLFFKVAAGLCLYFIASSLWGIAERKMLPKPAAADSLAVAAPASSPLRERNAEAAAARRNKKSKKKKR